MTDSSREDLQLAESVLRKQSGAFERLYRQHLPAVYGYAMGRLGDANAAEEAAQETFVQALKSLPGYRGEAPLSAWLMTIARRTVSGQRAGKAGPDFDLATRPVEDLGLGRAETRELVEMALAGLSPRERKALVGYYGKGRDIDEVAERAGVNASAAHSLLQRARGKFRAAFERLARE
jgi:RNA polymerase sigma-70 factor (ECF subfamily)